MDIVWEHAMNAQQYGRLYQWLQWFAGGLCVRLPPVEAAEEATKECGL